MANMRNHRVTEVWRVIGSDKRYHVTAGNRVLVTTGPKGGGAKLLYVITKDGCPSAFNTCGMGRRATATEAREHILRFNVVQEDIHAK